jgi:predicted metal-dependent hydrolase
VPPSSSRTWLCATQSLCFGDLRQKRLKLTSADRLLVMGSVRRECLDHVIVVHESSLRRILNSYFDYYHRSRTHPWLGKDSPQPRAIQPPAMGSVVAVSQSVDCTTATNDGLPERV